MNHYRYEDFPFFSAKESGPGTSSPPSDSDSAAGEMDEIRQALDEVMRSRYGGTNQSYHLWFALLKLVSLDAEKAVFACENKFKYDILSERYLVFIADSLEEVIGYRPALELVIDSSLAPLVRQEQTGQVGQAGQTSQTGQAARSLTGRPDDERNVQISMDTENSELTGSGMSDESDGSDAYGNTPGPDGEDGWENQGDGGFTVLPGGRIRIDLTGRIDNSSSPFGSRPGYINLPSGRERPSAAPLPPQTEAPDKPTASDAEDEAPGRTAYDSDAAFRRDYTFENFIVGSSNQMAHAAAVSVADNVGMSINPLFIWGASGLGKTHLMYAIANRAAERDPSLNVICVKGEEFMNEMIEAIRKDRNQAFRDKYRKAGMLLLDDIQFIAGKESTQTEFFHTFEALYEDKKQIIITSDRPPKELTALEDRIRSRFEAGLLVDIQPPDYELRMAILRDKISQSHMQIPLEVIDFLANNLQENIRQLEGVVKRLSLHHMVSGDPITMETVLRVVPEYIRNTEPLNDTVARIISAVASHYRIKADDILGKDRKKNIQTARNVSMYLVRTVTGASFPQIGVFFYRDHSTVHSNVAKVESEIAADAVFEANVNEILKEIRRV
jgi:chromosomal replication initiator protein